VKHFLPFPVSKRKPVVHMDGEYRVLEQMHRLYSERKQAMLTLKPGFRYYASIPRRAWSLIAPSDCGEHGPAGHDALYQSGGDPGSRPDICEVTPAGTTWTQKEADEDFRDWMKHEGMKPRHIRRAYWAVRMFGASSFKKPGAGAR
jgi:hypothetical protein